MTQKLTIIGHHAVFNTAYSQLKKAQKKTDKYKRENSNEKTNGIL